ncbi:hypothetical protein [Nonomuraea dietziae]|uniref:Uncharacterized protein n=1 Tax=Nonomuraea dietziae TaxID=65515 RepID=A0A7W5UZZ3_9ACTN|nr:hypothetical protein [Nonomuraea dietziae]MBB3725135.1 hypothetical protein [Nonomuraea dietziae]
MFNDFSLVSISVPLTGDQARWLARLGCLLVVIVVLVLASRPGTGCPCLMDVQL